MLVTVGAVYRRAQDLWLRLPFPKSVPKKEAPRERGLSIFRDRIPYIPSRALLKAMSMFMLETGVSTSFL